MSGKSGIAKLRARARTPSSWCSTSDAKTAGDPKMWPIAAGHNYWI